MSAGVGLGLGASVIMRTEEEEKERSMSIPEEKCVYKSCYLLTHLRLCNSIPYHTSLLPYSAPIPSQDSPVLAWPGRPTMDLIL